MIKLASFSECCGCSSCVQVCPKQCISFDEDNDGFRHPLINTEKCIDCHLCEKSCPVLDIIPPHEPKYTYYAYNINDEERINSSSGGVFIELAKLIIQSGGIVFGAKYNDNWEVVHSYSESIDGLNSFQGTKYVQSIIGDSYKKVQYFLKQNKLVLFTGTPCQVAGLHYFLKKQYDNLITIDFVCHGVPSPLMWRNYLEYINPDRLEITKVNMRDKSRGWSHSSYLIQAGSKDLFNDYAKESIYFRGFITNLYLRQSCFNCRFKYGKSQSDITIGDLWGAKSISTDDKGLSLVLINSLKGKDLFSKTMLKYSNYSYADAVKYNPCIEISTHKPKLYDEFWKLFSHKGILATYDIIIRMKPNIFERCLSKFKKYIIRKR